MDTLRELFKKTIAVLIVITIITSRLLFAGFGLITYAIDSLSTSNENVEILAYFVDEQGEKVVNIEQKVDKTLVLKIDVTTKNEEGQGGYFDGNIEIANANFKLKDDSEMIVHVNAGETKTVEREIEYLPAENMYEGYLERDASITVRGTYVNSIGDFDVEGIATTRVKWVSEENTNASISAEILTNKTYENGKKVLQVLVNSMLENSSYPVKHDHLEIDFPVEAQNIKVHKRVATNTNEGISYNTDEGKTIIDMENSIDPLVITYELPENIDLENATLNATEKITLYDQKEVEATTQLLVDNEEKDGSLTNSLIEKENKISKGKIYTGEEREYSSATRVYIDNIEPITNIQINENKSVFVDDTYEEIELNSNYINSRISKTEIDRILGEEGYITIKDQDENIIANINKDTEVDENGNIVINYGEDTKNIIIITSKPVSTGIMTIINNKKIVENKTREEVENLSYIKEQNEVNGKIAEGIINLKETESNVKITTENSTISTLSNEKQNLRIGIKLDSSEESKELFKNPKLTLTLPKEITELEIEQSKALYKNGLEIKNAKLYKNENGNYAMDLAFEGEQKTYDTNGGTEIYIYLKVKADKLTPTKTSIINLTYTNDIKNVNKEVTSEIKFESQNGLMVYTEANNVSTMQGEEIEAKLEMGKETKEVGTKTILINNYEKELNNVVITGEIKDNTFKMTLNRIINSKNAKIYYSKDGQNWTENSNEATQYKITIDKINAAEKVEINSIIGIDQNLGYNQTGKIIEKITYLDNETEQTKTRNIILKTEEKIINRGNNTLVGAPVSTDVGNGITAEITTTTGDEELEAGADVYEGQTIKYNIKITNNSGNEYSNVNLSAIQTKGKVWKINKIQGYNPYHNENTMGSFYQPSEETEISFGKIERLANGEIISFVYEAMIDTLENATGTNTFGTIKIITDDGTLNKEVKTIENNIKDAELSIKIEERESEEETWLEGNVTNNLVTISNLSNNTLNNVVFKIGLSKNLSVPSLNQFLDIDNYIDRITISEPETNGEGEKVVTVNIAQIQGNETLQMNLFAKMDKVEDNKKTGQAVIIGKATVNSNSYVSNLFMRNYYIARKSIVTTIEGLTKDNKKIAEDTIVENGDSISLIATIKNEDDLNAALSISDHLMDGLKVEKVTLTEDGNETDITSKVSEKDFCLNTVINAHKQIQIKFNLKVNTDYLLDENVNNTIEVLDVDTIENYKAEIKFKAKKITNYEKEDEPENPSGDNPIDDPGTETPGGTTPGGTTPGGETPGGTTPGGSDEPTTPGTSEDVKYKIKGTVWIDSNENGTREVSEQRLKDITVRAINVKTGTLENTTVNTNEEGMYSLELNKGNYILIFMYDDTKYYVTTYQAKGVSEDSNSDAVTRTIKIGEETKKIAATDELNINKNINNIDLGLVQSKKFDLKLEKYVKQIIVTNSKGTKTYNQDSSTSLAKVEISSKLINGSNVVIVYSFKVTNIGEVEGYASSIVDYLPTTLSFKEGINKNWYKSGDKIYNTSLANTIIKPGESKEITLTVTKSMTSSNVGLVNNRAEIEQSKNSLGLTDKTEDNASADVLISISTGKLISYIIITFSIVGIMCGIEYFILKKILKEKIKIG